MKSKGILLVISAPSGCGKSTVVHRLMEKRSNIGFSVSATTRKPRTGEQDGKDYFFVTREKFDEMIAQDAFFEHAEYAGNCYGTPKEPVIKSLQEGRDIILEIDVQGAFQVKKKLPEALLIFIMPPSFEELERRLVSRGTDSPEVIKVRLETAKKECLVKDSFDHIVINDEVEKAVERIEKLIDNYRED